MTNEEKDLLFTQINDLLNIYNTYEAITNEGFNFDSVKKTYEKMMEYIIPELEYRERLFSWMDEKKFWKTPASTMYHGNFEGGLAVHTLQVIFQSLKFAKPLLSDYFTSKVGEEFTFSAQDIFLAALAHDFCKADSYEINFRNTKDIVGNWVKKPYYKTKSNLRTLGHGNESAYILLDLIPEFAKKRLLIEAVSRHMGFSDLTDLEKISYSNLLNNPLILLLQLADQTASSWYDN